MPIFLGTSFDVASNVRYKGYGSRLAFFYVHSIINEPTYLVTDNLRIGMIIINFILLKILKQTFIA